MRKGWWIFIILAVIALVIGYITFVLTKSIFCDGCYSNVVNVAEISNDQLRNKVSTFFGDLPPVGNPRKIVFYPDSKSIEVLQGKLNGFGIGILNIYNSSAQFSYDIVIADPKAQEKCGVSEDTLLGLIFSGKAQSNIAISSEQYEVFKVLFSTDAGSPVCIVRYRINVLADDQAYSTAVFDAVFRK